MGKAFWEDSYKRPERLDTFGGGRPSQELVRYAAAIKPRSRVLDLGCGEGRQALYLAKLGHIVYAIDISESGIAKLRQVAANEAVQVETRVSDMREYVFPDLDLIVCHGCLHLIHRSEWMEVIRRMKAATAPGGYNLVGVFTDEVPEPEDQRGLMVGLFRKDELRAQYGDWQVLEDTGCVFEHTHPDGPKHSHSANSLIARKPL